MIETIGFLGATIVMYSNVPQMWLFIKQGHAIGISKSANWIGLVGLLLRTIYLAHSTNYDMMSLAPYFFAIACTILTFYYMYFPKEQI